MKKFTFVKGLLLFFILLANISFSVSFAKNCSYIENLLDNPDYDLEKSNLNGNCINGFAIIKISSIKQSGIYKIIGVVTNGNFEGLVSKEFKSLTTGEITNYPNIFVYKDKIFTDVDEYIDFMYENTEVDFGIWDAINIRIDDYGRSSFYNLLIYFAIGITLLIFGYIGYTKNRNKDKYILKANQVNPAKPINKHVNVVSQKSGQEVLVDLKDEQVNLATQKAEQERIAKEIMAKEWAEEDKRAKPSPKHSILKQLEEEVKRVSKEIRSNKLVTVEEFNKKWKHPPKGYDFKKEKEIIKQLENEKIGKSKDEIEKYEKEILALEKAISKNVTFEMCIMNRARLAPIPYNGKNFCTFVDYATFINEMENRYENAKDDRERESIKHESDMEIKKMDYKFFQLLEKDLKEFEELMQKNSWKTLGPDAPILYGVFMGLVYK